MDTMRNEQGRFAAGHTGFGTQALHGMRGTRTYNSWRGMIQRCADPKNVSFPNYGARGISVCPRWLSLRNFLKDMGERPEGKTLDRFPDCDGNYEPSNCRWATPAEQNSNRRV